MACAAWTMRCCVSGSSAKTLLAFSSAARAFSASFIATRERISMIQPSGSFGDDYERLVALKEKYDPTNFFHENQNIPPNNAA